MLCPPPANRPENDRNVDEREDSKEGAEQGAPVWFFDERPQQEVGNVEKPEHKRRGKPCIPRPVNSPCRLGPNRPRDQYDGGERKANFRRRNAQRIPFLVTPPNVEQVRHKTYEKRRHSRPR